MDTKRCKGCNKELDRSNFCKHSDNSDGLSTKCRTCRSLDETERRHKTGKNRPLETALDSSSWLGVHIAERILSKYFEGIKQMPYGHSGWDFECRLGFKIDSKCGCLMKMRNTNPYWQFGIHKNKDTDYFLCLGFDDRVSLKPMRIWLIPGNVINMKTRIGISNTPRSLAKWARWEKPIDKVVACCNVLR